MRPSAELGSHIRGSTAHQRDHITGGPLYFVCIIVRSLMAKLGSVAKICTFVRVLLILGAMDRAPCKNFTLCDLLNVLQSKYKGIHKKFGEIDSSDADESDTDLVQVFLDSSSLHVK